MDECRCPKCESILPCLEGPPPGTLRCGSCGALTEVPVDAPLIGRVIGGHHIIRRIGSGGVGTVYLATQLSLRRRVAFKALKVEWIDDPQALELFRNEAVSAARLNHPNIVHIHDIASDHGVTYLTMEFVNGVSLRQLIASEGQLTTTSAIGLAKQMLLALAKAHRQHIVHRDVKPENVLIGDDGLAKVADFGLAGVLIRGDQIEHLDMGTPHYMSPEHARGEPLDLRADIYSVGATMYHMLTGKPPHQGDTVKEILDHLKIGEPPPVAELNPMVPATLAAIVEKMMARERSDRYQSAEDALRALEMFEVSQGVQPSAAVSPGRGGTLRSVAAAETTRADLVRSQDRRQRRWSGALIFIAPSIALALAGMALLVIFSPGMQGVRNGIVQQNETKALLRAANRYDEAVYYAEDNPDDYAGIVDRFERAALRASNTPYKIRALRQATDARKRLNERASPQFRKLSAEAEAFATKGQYDEAERVFDKFPRNLMDSDWREEIMRAKASCRAAAKPPAAEAPAKAP